MRCIRGLLILSSNLQRTCGLLGGVQAVKCSVKELSVGLAWEWGGWRRHPASIKSWDIAVFNCPFKYPCQRPEQICDILNNANLGSDIKQRQKQKRIVTLL